MTSTEFWNVPVGARVYRYGTTQNWIVKARTEWTLTLLSADTGEERKLNANQGEWWGVVSVRLLSKTEVWDVPVGGRVLKTGAKVAWEVTGRTPHVLALRSLLGHTFSLDVRDAKDWRVVPTPVKRFQWKMPED